MKKPGFRFSLVLATVDRTEEVGRFFKHLDAQTYRDFEVIMVDQNTDGRLVPIVKSYEKKFPILHLRNIPRGLSRARNIGLEYVRGDIVGFPDDDCWYPKDFLEKVAKFLSDHPDLDGLSVRVTDENGQNSLLKWARDPGFLTRFSVFRRVVSHGLFLRRSVVEAVGRFDESLGVGAGTPWGAGEEIDYVLRALKKGVRIYYWPNTFLYHPNPVKNYDQASWQRALMYGRGNGRVLRKHEYPAWFILYLWIRLVGGIVIALIQGQPGKAAYRWFSLKGQIRGWAAPLKEKNEPQR